MLLLFALLLLAQPDADHQKARFTDARTGVSFTYPREYTLKRGPLGAHDTGLGYLGPIPMEFPDSGGIRIATIEAPAHSYPGTDFVNAFFTVSVNSLTTPRNCRHFRGSEDKSPVFLLKTKSGLILHGVLQSDGGMGHQFVGEYFQTYSKGDALSSAMESQPRAWAQWTACAPRRIEPFNLS